MFTVKDLTPNDTAKILCFADILAAVFVRRICENCGRFLNLKSQLFSVAAKGKVVPMHTVKSYKRYIVKCAVVSPIK
jgi:hypothetical protein